MKSQRLLAIASFIEKKDKLIDIGCDHGYLGIYLKETKNIDTILLTDIKQSALDNAISNIKNHNLDIPTLKTNGLNNINLNNYNTISISGMGYLTIKKILSNLKDNNTITKIIIQSNNNLSQLRMFMFNLGFYLDDEITIFEKNIFYVIGCFKKGQKKLTNKEILFGIDKKDKKTYYKYLLTKKEDILKKIPINNKQTRTKLEKEITLLQELLKESR